MSATHTPGPWEANENADIYAYGECLAATFQMDVGGDVHANARLIAAAPDMLAAMKDLVRTVYALSVNDLTVYPAYRNAIAVIAKAEGIVA